jgi:Cu2+-exporting ATPase
MMKKYVCPMGCLPAGRAGVEPQDQPGNCPECGMKLLPADERGLKHGLTQIHADNNISVHPREHQSKSAVEDFLKKFWLSLILTIIVIFVSFTPYESIARDFRKS